MFGNIFDKVFGKRPDVPRDSVIGANSALMKKHWPIHARDRNALSHLGGDPLLPSAADWPLCVFEGEQQPIHFLAQIDCSSLPQFDGRSLLPQTGLLSFFLLIHEELGGEDENTCAVRYFPMSQRLERYIPPENLMPNYAARTYDQGFMDFLSPAKSNLAVRRFGFVPITLEPFKTQIHPEASPMAPWGPAPEPTKENLEAYYAEREAAMDSILGKEPEDDNPARYILESSWPQTVYAARQALQQIAASLQIKYAETFSMVHPPADDQRKFEPKLSTISADWLDKMKPVQLALNQLEGRPILDDAGDEIRGAGPARAEAGFPRHLRRGCPDAQVCGRRSAPRIPQRSLLCRRRLRRPASHGRPHLSERWPRDAHRGRTHH